MTTDQYIEAAKIVILSTLMLACGWLLVRTRRPRRSAQSARRWSKVAAKLVGLGQADQEMLELGRALMAKLDGKIEALEDLVRDAEVQIARLEALNKVAAGVTGDERPSSVQPRPSIQLAQGIKGIKANLRVDLPDDRVGPREARRHEEIYALADSGLTSAAIAGHVGSPVGEIELILGLREKGR